MLASPAGQRQAGGRTASAAGETEAVRRERLAAIGQRVTEISHESRNSLQCIQAAVEMLSRDIDASSRPAKNLARIERAVGDLGELFEEIRSYAAPLQLRRDRVELPEIWRTAWSRVAVGHAGSHLDFAEEITAHRSQGALDRFRIEQVFRNLFENSLAACPETPRIRIRCADAVRDGQEFFRIAVCDNGPGIAESARRSAFDAFYTTKRKGTGLGLAIVKRIVEAHGGSIAFGPNLRPGAQVIFTLPRQTPDA